MKKQLYLIFILLFGFSTLYAQRIGSNLDAQQTLSKSDKHFFIENKGQWPSDVLYLAQLGGLNTWITKNGMLFEFYKTEEINHSEKDENTTHLVNKYEQKDYKRWGQRVAFSLIGNNTEVQTQGKQKQSGYYNYLIGNDPSKHASFVGLYKEAVIQQIYEGIDMRYYFDKGSLRYDYIVHPGADPSQIKFNLEGSEKNYLNEKGELVFTTCFGEVKNVELYCYQQQDKKTVQSKFIESENSFSFAIGSYNKNETLIIDPLIYSTYIGGTNEDHAFSISLDNSYNTYITGWTLSSNYDITPGPFQNYVAGLRDVFVTKTNLNGTALIYSTYIGGNGGNDEGYSIAIDTATNVFITGTTKAHNYDITTGAYQTNNGGNYDAFVTKLNTTGSALIYSTYIGGSLDEKGTSICIDNSGNAYITGETSSTNFDITVGSFKTTHSGGKDVFITKLNPTGTTLLYSTFVGGNLDDYGKSITIDAYHNAYITGYTNSTNFDITTGSFQTTKAQNNDVFVTKINDSGSSLIYSTFIGGVFDDEGQAITIDASNNAYVTGSTNSGDYKITPGSYQTTLSGSYDAFVTKIDSFGANIIYSTFLGGISLDIGYDIEVDATGNSFLTGTTYSSNFITTTGALQLFSKGNSEGFISKINNIGNTLLYSTYFGGSGQDESNSITLDAWSNVYITGSTTSINFDTTSGVFQSTNAGNWDVFIGSIAAYSHSTITLISAPFTSNQSLCINSPLTNIQYKTTGTYGVFINGLPPGVNSNFTNGHVYIVGTPTLSGVFNYTITLTTGNTTITGTISVNNCTSIEEAFKDNLFSISPNPSSGIYLLTFEKRIHNDGFIEVYDMHGRLIHNESISTENTLQLNLANQPVGMYILKVKSGNSQEMVRLVKM